MKLQGFVGPSYELKSINADCQRCVNLYPEVIESGSGKESQVAYLKSTPGLKKIATLIGGPIRMIHIDSNGDIIVVAGNRVYNVYKVVDTWTYFHIGFLMSDSGAVRAASIFVEDSHKTIIVDGLMNYLLENAATGTPASSFFFNTFDTLSFLGELTATHIAYIDGYLVFNKADSNQFFVSEWNSLSVDPLSFASAEGNPDKIVSIAVNNRDLWLFNEKSIEIWSNTGNADFPFERVSGGYIEKGCLAPNSVAKIDGVMFWLGRDESGQGIVYAANGMVPQRISTHAIEEKIATYVNITSVGEFSPTLASGYTYQKEGHSFYVLNFDEATWVYDLSTKLWHERAYTNSGELERHRANTCIFDPRNNIHLVGDYANGNVYILDDKYYYDDIIEITRLRTSPHASAGLKKVFYKSLQIDMETGVGLDGSVLGSDPQVMLQYSNDGGHTWSSSESWTSAGKKVGGIGQYKTRVIWRRLGYAYDRVFKLKITDPVPVTILSAEVDYEVGVS